MFKFLLPLLSCFFVSTITAQQLQNTTWKTLSPTSPDTNTVIATMDTLYVNGPTGSNLVTALFAEQDDTLFISDLSGPISCTIPDTGLYKFNITNDTLVFNLIYDSCGTRVFALDGAVLWRNSISTSISVHNENDLTFTVFPNPSRGQINIVTTTEGNIEIRNIYGEIIVKKNIPTGKSIIDENLPNGNFILLFRSNDQIAHELMTIRH